MKRWLSKRLSVAQAPLRSIDWRRWAAGARGCPGASRWDGGGPGILRQRLALPSRTEPWRGTSRAHGHGDLPDPAAGASQGRTASL